MDMKTAVQESLTYNRSPKTFSEHLLDQVSKSAPLPINNWLTNDFINIYRTTWVNLAVSVWFNSTRRCSDAIKTFKSRHIRRFLLSIFSTSTPKRLKVRGFSCSNLFQIIRFYSNAKLTNVLLSIVSELANTLITEWVKSEQNAMKWVDPSSMATNAMRGFKVGYETQNSEENTVIVTVR